MNRLFSGGGHGGAAHNRDVILSLLNGLGMTRAVYDDNGALVLANDSDDDEEEEDDDDEDGSYEPFGEAEDDDDDDGSDSNVNSAGCSEDASDLHEGEASRDHCTASGSGLCRDQKSV
eukprot:scaffold146589_cov44-Prasinocladus_malaysianus.AAC.2